MNALNLYLQMGGYKVDIKSNRYEKLITVNFK